MPYTLRIHEEEVHPYLDSWVLMRSSSCPSSNALDDFENGARWACNGSFSGSTMVETTRRRKRGRWQCEEEGGKRGNLVFLKGACHVSHKEWGCLAPLAICHVVLSKRGWKSNIYHGVKILPRFACPSSSLSFSRFSAPNGHGFQR